MKKKFSLGWRVAIALVLVASLGMVFAAPAGGDPGVNPALELKPSDVGFQSAGNGMAEWSVEQSHSAPHSAKLTVPISYTITDAGRVALPHYCDVNGITSLSYYYYVGADTPQTVSIYDGYIKGNACVEPSGGGYAAAYGGPYLIIELDADHDGAKDTWVVQTQFASTTQGSWLQDTINPAVSPFHAVTILSGYTSPFAIGTDWGSLNEVKAASLTHASLDDIPLGTAKVLKVKIAVGEWDPAQGLTGPVVAYIDSVEINGQVWDMEPTDDDCARTGEAVQVFVDDSTANTEGTAVDEMSTTDPVGTTHDFDVAHAPKSVVTTSAKDLGGALDVTGVAQTPTGGTVTITETPPAEYSLLPCSDAAPDINDTAIYPTTPTQLTVTSLNETTNCVETAPGSGNYMYIFITGTTGPGGTGTPINELLYILGTDTEETTTQTFGTIIAYGVDATYSTGSAATALKIGAENHVWVTYDWHQADTVTVSVTSAIPGVTPQCVIQVECSEVDPTTLQPDKDSGFFKGTFYLRDMCDDGLDWLLVEHCKTVTAEYDGLTDSIFIDDEPPTFSNQSPYPSTNESQPEISVDISDEKCPVREESLRLFFDTTDPPTAGEVFDFAWDGSTLTWTPPETLTDCTYYIRVKAADCCWNWAEIDWQFEVECSPPMMIDAITGWTWVWGPMKKPVNTHTRTSIMVVFSEFLNPITVEKEDFTVDDTIPLAAEYHDYEWTCNAGYKYGLVFLTLATPLATDDTPTVVQVGDVEDLAGNSCTKAYTWTCDMEVFELVQPQTVIAQDGIGPMLTVTASPEEPGYNQMVTVTVVATEPLSEAYLYYSDGYPDTYYWPEIKPIGWPPKPPHVPEGDWVNKEWLVMTEVEPNRWTAEFLNTFGPDTPWFVEVAAHDSTQWWQDMVDGSWEDCECVLHPKCWKHEKWTEESLIFEPKDNFFIELYEGWNLISVPRNLIDPSLEGFFGGKGVTTVFYYTGGPEGDWQWAARDPETGDWYSGSAVPLTTIEPGKGYWMWCSPPWTRLPVRMKPIDPLAPPPSYNLVAGWNMIGVTMLNPTYFAPRGGERMFMHDYLSSLGGGEHGNATWSVLYWYYLSGPGGSWGWLRTTPNSLYEMIWWCVYWNEWSCPMAMPGHGYWIFINQPGVVLAP